MKKLRPIITIVSIITLFTALLYWHYQYNMIYIHTRLDDVKFDLTCLKIVTQRYQSTYNRVPSRLEEMLSSDPLNSRKQVFMDSDEVPIDPYSGAAKQTYKLINHIASTTIDDQYKVTAYTTDPAAQNLIIYSVGKNGVDDRGLFDPDTDKDDIALFVQIESQKKSPTPE